jgi:hypothetical protein
MLLIRGNAADVARSAAIAMQAPTVFSEVKKAEPVMLNP